ncbi:hypothetical protein VCHA53O463_10164 [Vibrio chagasii]|nr:hypothetical protein VCHA56P515_10164 [Vibrio chagasii]CAH7110118.1 hypothetical protein VCHA53O463_10164 [Vibrio chagasii]
MLLAFLETIKSPTMKMVFLYIYAGLLNCLYCYSCNYFVGFKYTLH